MSTPPRTVWAVADLHAAIPANRARLAEIMPDNPEDWLIVAGDVAERTELVVEILTLLRSRYARVIWVPGNHELFSHAAAPTHGRGKYRELVEACRRLGVDTPEDEYPRFAGVTVVPLFLLYDYSLRAPGCTVEEALRRARERQVVMTDEYAIAPFVDVRAWCWERLAYSVRRLATVSGPTVLVNHWPLVPQPTWNLGLPELALWCGTRHTRDWARRYHARCVVYGHLHLPGTITVDGVPHHEVSLGYPRERRARAVRPGGGARLRWPLPVLREEEP